MLLRSRPRFGSFVVILCSSSLTGHWPKRIVTGIRAKLFAQDSREEQSMCTRKFAAGLLLPLATAWLVGCATPKEGGARPAAEQEQAARQDVERKLNSRIAAMQLELVVQASEKQRLIDALDLARKQLDEAVLEVVRSKAKLGSLGSRAEAATALAESESLAKTLQGRSPQMVNDQDYRVAERLLALGNQEFRNDNFGGAYYLASNARTAFAVMVARTASAVPSATGDRPELRFPQPVDLSFSSRGNVRERPSTEARAIRVAEKATPVKGVSARDLWILVEFADGMRGWAFHDLLAPAP